MSLTQSVSILLAITHLVAAQQIVPAAGSSTFPACAVSCPPLLQAQTTCTPPSAVVSSQQYYDSCFCSASYLQDLYTTGETICTSLCTVESDRQLLSTWFVNLCASVGQTYGTASASASAAPTTLTTSTTNTASGTAQTGAASTMVVGLPSTDTRPWIKSHWQWILFLIILFFGLLGLGIGARWLKKRHDLKLEQQSVAMSGFPVTEDKKLDRERALSPELWGPSQHMAASKGYQYNTGGGLPVIDEDLDNDNSKQKGKRASRVAVTELQPVPPAVPKKDNDSSSSSSS